MQFPIERLRTVEAIVYDRGFLKSRISTNSRHLKKN